ncbi:hypothetical protein GSI_05947 [Ganoderma sinense ZZ0214-1]|uniref:Uncharacterized protein n=1 Tax=Ganoderma sinense ZZ0214-1 TaxID=1077348 RepID=A0A2G8SBW7_9APHY|nr:hypothetical protein GSI_05947 [Ganoderma sinense ZZ0214-1]
MKNGGVDTRDEVIQSFILWWTIFLTSTSLFSMPVPADTSSSSNAVIHIHIPAPAPEPEPAPPLSEEEAAHYYAGLPTRPRLLARTSTTPWVPPPSPGPHAHLRYKRKQFSAVGIGDHALAPMWERPVAPKVVAYLNERGVNWTSVDVVRIWEEGEAGEEGTTPAPVVLWIGVAPRSLARDDAHAAAFGCLEILRGFGVTDVEVEIRE